MDNQQGPTVYLMELCSIIYSNLVGKRIWKRIDTCICKTESLFRTPEANTILLTNCSIQFSCSVMSDSLQPHGLQQARLPCPKPTPGVYSNSCPLSWWCHPTISSCCPLLLPPSIFPSIRVFSNESALRIRWPKYWSFSSSISLSNEYSGLISFKMDWLDLLAVQGTLKSLLQHHSSKASIVLQYKIKVKKIKKMITRNGNCLNDLKIIYISSEENLLLKNYSNVVRGL